jgi:hypothetical protein
MRTQIEEELRRLSARLPRLRAAEEHARAALFAADGRVEALEAAGHCRIWSGQLLAAEVMARQAQSSHAWARHAIFRLVDLRDALVVHARGHLCRRSLSAGRIQGGAGDALNWGGKMSNEEIENLKNTLIATSLDLTASLTKLLNTPGVGEKTRRQAERELELQERDHKELARLLGVRPSKSSAPCFQ